VEHSSSLEANSSSATPEITRILYKPKVRKRVHNSQPFVPILGHVFPFHASITYFLRDPLILSPSLRLVLSSALFPSSFPTKTRYVPLFPPTCPMPSPSIFFFNFITKWYLVMGPDYVLQMVRVSISLVYWKQCLDKGINLHHCTTWRYMGEWRESSTNSWPRHYVIVCDQFHRSGCWNSGKQTR